MLSSGNGRRPACKRAAFAVQGYASSPDADDRGMSRLTVGLLACIDGRHDGALGRQAIFVSLYVSPAAAKLPPSPQKWRSHA